MFGPSNAKSFDDESNCANSPGTLSEAGIIPRALRTVFNRLNKLKLTRASGSDTVTNYEYEVKQNDNKRYIYLPMPEVAIRIEQEYAKLMAV